MSVKTPFISVIIPTYNRKELLEKAIISVLEQEQSDSFQWELIIVDDGSTDGTREYIGKHIEKFPHNITYIYQENSWVWRARNMGISAMNTSSDYLILLDSDDEFKKDLFVSCIRKWADLEVQGIKDTITWLYFLCEDENGRIIGQKEILWGKNEKTFDYMSFLWGEINIAMMQILKSSLFFQDPNLRFPEDVINETVMFARMWQYMNRKNQKILLWDYVGYIYRQEHTGAQKITKTITRDRFKKNALGNEQVFDIIKADLLRFWFQKNYSEFLFRIWINWILSWEKSKWLSFLGKAIKYDKSLRNIGIFLLAVLHKNLVLSLYKAYIQFEH